MKKCAERIRGYNIGMTNPNNSPAKTSLHEQIDDYVMLTEAVMSTGKPQDLELELSAYLSRCTKTVLPELADDDIAEWTKYDAMLNAQGLAHWWQTRR